MASEGTGRRRFFPENPGGIPGSIWALGFVSLFMDMSSELVHSLLPVFMVSVLGASVLSVGLVEGVAEAATAVTRLFSGSLSDYLGRRKGLTVFGYGMSALAKPLFAMAPTVGWVFGARFIDRVGKGIRAAPRDALVGDLAPPEMRGACYGLRQSLDTVGALLGPALAIALMALMAADMRAVFWFAVIPGTASVLILILAVREPQRTRSPGAARTPIRLASLARLGRAYWWVVIIGSLLTLARFSEAFLVLRAQSAGMSMTLVPSVLVVMSALYAVSAYPAGVISDRIGRGPLLALGFLALLAADVVLALATTTWQVMAGAALWGLHMGLTQGLLAALVTDASPAGLRGTAFGFFNFSTSLMLLAAGVLAGLLWDLYGPPAAFLAGAGFTVLALLGLSARRFGACGNS